MEYREILIYLNRLKTHNEMLQEYVNNECSLMNDMLEDLIKIVLEKENDEDNEM